MEYLRYFAESQGCGDGVDHDAVPVAVGPRRVVMAMWKETYLRRARHLLAALRTAYGPAGTADWSADRTDRSHLITRLATAHVPLAFYLGHGRERGWTGYRGLRWHHLEHRPFRRPLGALVSLSCSNLEFGRKWVGEGRAQAFLGSPEPVRVTGLVRLVSTIADCFSGRPPAPPVTIGQLVEQIDRRVDVRGEGELSEAWDKFILLGDPGAAI